MLSSRICRLHFETEKVLGNEWRHNTSCIVYWEKHCVLRHQFQRGVKPQCGDPGHRITLCEINSIKTDNIDGYIINTGITCISSFTKNKIIIVISIYWSLTWESFEGNNSNDILSFNHYYLCLKWSTSLSGHKHLASNCKVIQWTFDIMLFPNFLSPSYMNEYAVCQLTYHGLVSYSVELRNMTWPGFNFYFGNTVYCGGLYSWFIKFL